MSPDSSYSQQWQGITCAPRARHFTMRSRRAAGRSAPPLNCGLRPI